MSRTYSAGVILTLFATVAFGFAPIFGKLALQAGASPYTVVAARTVIAAALLWLFYLVFWRSALRVTWPTLLNCIGMGLANGLGSILYYAGLARVSASLGQLLYALYPVWVFIFLSAAGHPVSRLAVGRLVLALLGVWLLTQAPGFGPDVLGAMLMVAAGAMYGWHLVMGQWTLADVDSRTVTLYVLTTMAAVVVVARLLIGGPLEPIPVAGWSAIVGLAILPTALARLLVFAGLRTLGGVQASILGVAELAVAVVLAFLLLGERLAPVQWLGAGAIVSAMLLIGRETSLETDPWEEWLPVEQVAEDYLAGEKQTGS